MGLFDDVRKGLQKFTPAGWAGLYNDNSVDYNSLFQNQLAIYNQQIAERNRLANATDVQNANLAATTILTGGSKPASTGTPLSNDLSMRTASDAAVTGQAFSPTANTEGLTGDSLALQQQRNKEATDKFIKSMLTSGNRIDPLSQLMRS